MGVRQVKVPLDLAINDVILLHAHGRTFSEVEFTRALHHRQGTDPTGGLTDSASVRSWALRSYRFIQGKGVRELTQLAFDVLVPASSRPIIRAASNPPCFQEAWTAASLPNSVEFRKMALDSDYKDALYSASTRCQFISPEGDWSREALARAVSMRFSDEWVKMLSEELSHTAEDRPKTVSESPSETEYARSESRRELEHTGLGLKLILNKEEPGEFPLNSLRAELIDSTGAVENFGIRTKRWVLTGPQLLGRESCQRAHKVFLALWKDAEDGA